MSDNKVEFELAMKDEATRVINNFKANVSTQSKAVQDAFQKMQGATAGSTNALMNFNRVIQDAPYGIMGVANNLNPLFESFQRLTKETGSVKTALTSMLSTLASPAGIGVAIAAVSSLAVVFGKDLFNSIDDSTKKLNDLKLESIDLKVKLDELTKAQAMNLWNAEITKAELKMYQLRQTSIDWVATLKSSASGIPNIIYKGVGTPAEMQELQNQIDVMKLKVKGYADQAVKELAPALESITYKTQLARVETLGFANAVVQVNKNLKLARIEIPNMADTFQDFKNKIEETKDIVLLASYAMAQGMGQAFANNEPVLKAVLKSTINALLTAVEIQLIAANASAIAQGIISGGVTALRDVPALVGAVALIEGAKAGLSKLHNGGTVGNFQNQPASREFPIMVRGGETVRTEGQERDLQNSMRSGRGKGGTVLNVNFNAPVSDTQFVLGALKKVIRETGLTVDKIVVDNRSRVSLA